MNAATGGLTFLRRGWHR